MSVPQRAVEAIRRHQAIVKGKKSYPTDKYTFRCAVIRYHCGSDPHCLFCNHRGLLTMHHLNYPKHRPELPFDLIPLCIQCHMGEHQLQPLREKQGGQLKLPLEAANDNIFDP